MMAADSSSGPLEGLLVLELGQLLAGPFGGHLLADFGADVVKVEQPVVGDPMRDWGHNRYRDRSLWWPSVARNKKSITLDLRRPEGQKVLRDLVRQADVLIENFRPGTLERWELGPDRLHEINPGLVIARVSGYGQTGPYASRAGFASVGEAMGGLRYINGYPGQAPPRTGISLGDSLAAMFAVQGILMALHWRDGRGNGQGQVVDASIMESCFALLESSVTEYDTLGVIREPSGTGLVNVAPSNIYESKDGKWMVIAANADRIFERLCVAIGQPELANDERFSSHTARGENAEVLDEIISDWAGTLTAQQIDYQLNEAGVVCGPIYSIADIFDDPQYAHRGMLPRVRDEDLGEVAMPGIVPKLDVTPGEIRWPGPSELGAHTGEVLTEYLGMSRDEMDALRGQGAFGENG